MCVCVCVVRRRGREKPHQKGVPTKEFAGALEDAEPKSAGGRERAIKIGTQNLSENPLLCKVQGHPHDSMVGGETAYQV